MLQSASGPSLWSGGVESTVTTVGVNTSENVKAAEWLSSGAQRQELHIFIWGGGMSEDDPWDLSEKVTGLAGRLKSVDTEIP